MLKTNLVRNTLRMFCCLPACAKKSTHCVGVHFSDGIRVCRCSNIQQKGTELSWQPDWAMTQGIVWDPGLVVYRGKLLHSPFTKTYHTYRDTVDSNWLEIPKSGIGKTKLTF